MNITSGRFTLLSCIFVLISVVLAYFVFFGENPVMGENSGKENLKFSRTDPEQRTNIDSNLYRGNAERSSINSASRKKLETSRGTNLSDPLQIAIRDAETSGDFSGLESAFNALSQNDRSERFLEIPAVFSKLGPKHDIAEKLSLLNKVNAPATTLETYKRRIFEMEARERYQSLKDEGVLTSLADEEFGYVCRALAGSRIKQGFQCIDDGGSESAKRTAAVMVAQYSIQAGTMEASREIASLPPGIIRDEAVAEMVIWLRKTESEDEADPWLKTIQDPKSKERATRR